ncbi:MAG: carboxypeptidase-like regulatory domain-containing protein [Crocinitomicaceae bacterium]
MKIKIIIAALLFAGVAKAQATAGTLRGQIFDDNNQTIPAASIFLEGQGTIIKQKTDLDGRFKITAVKPGLYTLKAFSFGMDTTIISAVEINPESLTELGKVELQMGSIMGRKVDVPYQRPLIPVDHKIEIPLSDIENSPFVQDPKKLFAASNSDVIMQEGSDEMIIRGSRPGDVIYYVDGVKSNNLNGVPGVGIGSMMGYTGGIPAKYGDTTGGVVILETKSYFDLYYAWKAKG